jgi:hypothetical protein
MGIVGMKKAVLKGTLCFSSQVGNGTVKKEVFSAPRFARRREIPIQSLFRAPVESERSTTFFFMGLG